MIDETKVSLDGKSGECLASLGFGVRFTAYILKSFESGVVTRLSVLAPRFSLLYLFLISNGLKDQPRLTDVFVYFYYFIYIIVFC